MASNKRNRVETENSLLDEIIYGCKQILESIIIKDEVKAIKYETKESMINFDIYRAAIEGRISLYYFNNITATDIIKAIPSLKNDHATVNKYLLNFNNIPLDHRTLLLSYLSNSFIENYEEKNDYYRLICGLPPSDQPIIYLKEKDVKDSVIDIDISKPIHELNDVEISGVISMGLIDKLKKRYPKATYLDYIDKGISFYQARLADKYGILYISSDIDDAILYKFQELYLINCEIVTRTMDDTAFKYYHDRYDSFLQITIILNTIGDLISEVPDYFINREVFDIRTAEYFFTAFGVAFYKEIPLRYQKLLVRNLNKLIKYKGTNKDIFNILDIFGFTDSCTVYKYYLNKHHLQNNDMYNQYVYDSTGQEYTFIGYSNKENDEKNYELRFVRVPLKEKLSDYIKDDKAIITYDNFIRSIDSYWNGDKNHETVKKEIAGMEFNSLITQFLSLSSNESIDEISKQITYFFNMVLYYGVDPNKMILNIPGIDSKNSKFTLFDILIYINVLMYMYIGRDPDIVTDPEKLAAIHGFDLYADLDQLLMDIEEMLLPLIRAEQETPKGTDFPEYILYNFNMLKTQVGLNTKKVDIGYYGNLYISLLENIFMGNNKFVTFAEGVAPTMKQIVNAYLNNIAIHDFIETKMIYCQDIDEYNIYKRLYDSLMTVTLNNKLFTIVKDGERCTASSYLEYIKYTNPRLFASILDLKALYGTEEYQAKLYDIITNICAIVTNYINSPELMKIFSDLPIDATDFLKQYMKKVISFFMSFKDTIIDSSSILTLDPDINRFNDHIYTNITYEPQDYNQLDDNLIIKAIYKPIIDIMRPQDKIIVNAIYE